MDQMICRHFLEILKSELIPALGCTEPIAIAFAAAKATAVLAETPDHIEMWCSGNIVKNVQGVTVPNSGGLKGINAAAILGALGGNFEKELQVLEGISPEIIQKTKSLVESGFCESFVKEGVENLYLYTKVFSGENSAEVEIQGKHTNVTKIVKNGEVIYEKTDENCDDCVIGDKRYLNVKDIIQFAEQVKIDDICEILDRQIDMNRAISDEGLCNNYGASVGRTLLAVYGDDIKTRAKARAAAGSDARMSGCSLPVVINSGSGNQGMTVSLPVIEYADELNVSKEELYRALVVSNLVALHQKKYIGNLSAYCGVVSAATGSGAGITFLYGGRYEEISRTIINTIANVGGIVCDGAKPSCAAKIASSVDAAIMGHHMGERGYAFASGEGIVKDVEGTIRNIGHVGAVGMKSTDSEILNIMLGRVQTDERMLDGDLKFTTEC